MSASPSMYVTDAEVQAVSAACRVLVAASARSDAVGKAVDPVQFRLLVIVSDGDGLSLGDLAEAVGLNAATAARAYERLMRAGFIDFDDHSHDHQRGLRLTQSGRDLVKTEVGRRREALEMILGRLSAARRLEFVAVLREFVATSRNDATVPVANQLRSDRTTNHSGFGMPCSSDRGPRLGSRID